MGKSITRSNEGLQRRFRISGRELCRLIRRLEVLICNDRLIIGGERITIPRNTEVKVEIKYEHDRRNELGIKIIWEDEQSSRVDRGRSDSEIDYENEQDD